MTLKVVILTLKMVNLTYFGLKMAILTLKVVNLTYYNLKGDQFKVILILKVVILTFKMVIFDQKVIKNSFSILAKFQILEFQISKIFQISDSAFRICLNISISTPFLVKTNKKVVAEVDVVNKKVVAEVVVRINEMLLAEAEVVIRMNEMLVVKAEVV